MKKVCLLHSSLPVRYQQPANEVRWRLILGASTGKEESS